jgi:hypothetical protein
MRDWDLNPADALDVKATLKDHRFRAIISVSLPSMPFG